MHGVALNVCNDLSPFKQIIPCGEKDMAITSVAHELQTNPVQNKVDRDALLLQAEAILLDAFKRQFGIPFFIESHRTSTTTL